MLEKAAAVVLGHTDELEIQRQVADVMAGRAWRTDVCLWQFPIYSNRVTE